MKEQSSSKLLVLDTIRIYYQASKQSKFDFLLAFCVPLGAVLMSVVLPFFAGKVLAGIAIPDTDLQMPLIMLAIVSAVGIVANRVGFNATMRMQAHTMRKLHNKVFDRLLQRSVGFHSDRVSGKLVSDAIDFINSYGMLVGAALLTGASFLLCIVVGLIIVFVNSWQLGLFLTAVVAITLAWAGIESRRRSELRNKRLVATKKLTAHLSDCIVNAPTVKTFAQESAESKHNLALNNTLEDLRLRDWQRAGRSASNRIAALLAMQFCMFLLIVHLTRANPAMLATGIFAFTYTLTLSNRLFEINNITRQIEEALLNASPITDMLRETVEIQDKPDAKELKVRKGTIHVNAIAFSYPEKANNSTVFEDFTLKITAGEKVGLVGPSGGGKSTLTRLLLRFDDVQRGEITIDDQSINEVTQASLRKALAYVPQEPLLFHRSIRENIAYGNPKATEKAIIAAAKKANAHDFIGALPRGYDTAVGERGVKLSGGQRQRVAIARAILKNAPILVLDEATSALDSENELQVQGALWELMEGRTAIVIAHRLSTIQRMDRIIVLDDGKIVEEGSHKKLLAKKGLYAKLWKHQSGGFLEE